MEEKLFEEEKSLFRKNLNEAVSDQPNVKVIKDIIKLVLLKSSVKCKNNLKLAEFYNYFGLDAFVDLIDIANGETISFPSIEEFKDTVKLSVSYYYKFLKGKSWDEIKELIDDGTGDSSTVKYGINCSKLNRFITELSEYQKFLEAHGGGSDHNSAANI
jgi:hypothetical protein